MMIKRFEIVLLIGVFLIAGSAKVLIANETAVSFNIGTSMNGYAGAGSNHGWQFMVNQSITLTHLGLFDQWPDGFAMEHQIGLWRLNDGALLASGTMDAGTVDPVTNHFRYIDVPDVQLSVGVNYVVGFYSPVIDADAMIIDAGGLQINPAINLIAGRNDGAGHFQMPANINTPNPPYQFFPDDFGPNFLFEVPEPCTHV